MSLILPQKVERIESPFIVACEGFGDVCLVEQLLKFRQIENCRVGCPSRVGVGGDGKDFLNKYLSAIALTANNEAVSTLQGLLVIVDADDSQQKAFDSACAALGFADYPVPDSPFMPKEENGVRTAIYIIPGENESGTLEHLLLRSAFESSKNNEACVDSFLNCIGKVPADQQNTQAKMRMSALVAASFLSNPWATPGPL
ncbi:MAG: DUF3226 domain-containing protein, partial [Terracidiphilus sp.]